MIRQPPRHHHRGGWFHFRHSGFGFVREGEPGDPRLLAEHSQAAGRWYDRPRSGREQSTIAVAASYKAGCQAGVEFKRV